MAAALFPKWTATGYQKKRNFKFQFQGIWFCVTSLNVTLNTNMVHEGNVEEKDN